jgi:hypothetical protein
LKRNRNKEEDEKKQRMEEEILQENRIQQEIMEISSKEQLKGTDNNAKYTAQLENQFSSSRRLPELTNRKNEVSRDNSLSKKNEEEIAQNIQNNFGTTAAFANYKHQNTDNEEENIAVGNKAQESLNKVLASNSNQIKEMIDQ